MDAFEVDLQTFNTTIYGTEMRKSLYNCFELIRISIQYHANKLKNIEQKINQLEGGSNGNA